MAESRLELRNSIKKLLERETTLTNLTKKDLIEEVLKNQEAFITKSGALATWTPKGSTGRIPDDTYIVNNPESREKIDWTCPTNKPISPELFESLWKDALEVLEKKQTTIYVTDKTVGADPEYALPVKTITDRAFTALFTENMFRNTPNIEKSVFADEEFILIALPLDRIDTKKYENELRKKEDGSVADMIVVTDMDRKIGLVYGLAYSGAVKKALFTVMNYLLPEHGVLPFHCGANRSPQGDSALFLGLSGTGKTTLSTDQNRPLVGDDEHGWSDKGIFNMEGGCYAKLIGFNPEKEPEITEAAFTKKPYQENGVLIENALMYPDGEFDFHDSRLSTNSRVSYPLKYLKNVDDDSVEGHPSKIIFLTADQNGVLPPVAKLNRSEAMFWFLIGYTSKLAGTEVGIMEPKSTFSRFFGGPFMPRKPKDYTRLLGEKIDKHGSEVFLVNTGWSGGDYYTGERIDLHTSRKIITAILNNKFGNVEFYRDERFKFDVPKSCPEIDNSLLNPKTTWKNKEEFEKKADILAKEFCEFFEQTYSGLDLDQEIINACPGK